MLNSAKTLVSNIISRFGYKLQKKETYNNSIERMKFLEQAIEFGSFSTSQLYQDLFVLVITRGKKNGFFVEFGAANGKYLSNTYLLEKQFNWTGILAEPAQIWFDDLSKLRSCTIDHRCVWSKSGEQIRFNETREPELSTIDRYSDNDDHALSRKTGNTYLVDTVSLLDLLDQNGAPRVIDYLSIDTEGSEYEILANFDFDKYDIKIITCEHNYTANREKINSLLAAKGYFRYYSNLSNFDDWYVRA